MLIKEIKEFLDKPFPSISFSTEDKIFLTWLGILVSFYILPIILADFYFADDWGRTMTGESWDGAGRWFQTAFYRFLSPIKLVDLAPLTQIIAGLFLIFSGFIIYKKILIEISPKVAAVICFIFIANPYFLENLSYRFDSVGMSLAIFLNCMAFYIATTEQNIAKNYIYSGIFIMLGLCTYQISFLIFVGLVGFMFVKNILEQQNKSQENIKILINSSAVVLITLMLYYIILNPLIGGVVENSYKFDIFSFSKNSILLKQIFHNKIMIVFFIIPFIVACIGYWVISFKTLKNNTTVGVIGLVNKTIVLLFPFIIILIANLNLFLLTNQTRPRIYYGFALLLLFMGYYFYNFFKLVALRKLAMIILFPAIYLMINSYSYSNFSKTINRDAKVISSYIIEDLKSLGIANKETSFVIIGKMPYSQQANRIRKHLLLNYPDSSYSMREMMSFSSSGMIKKDIAILEDGSDYNMTGAVLEKDNILYMMKSKDKTIIIEFKPQIYIGNSRGKYFYETE